MNFEQIISHIIADVNFSNIQGEDIANKADFDLKVKSIALESLPKYQPEIRESLMKIILEKETYDLSLKPDMIELENKHLVNLAEDIREIINQIDLPEILYESWLDKNLNLELNQVVIHSNIFDSKIVKIAAGIPVKTALDSMLHKDKWKKKKYTSEAYYQYQGIKKTTNFVEHYINKSDLINIKKLPFDEALQLIEKFGLDTAKLHLLLSAYACQYDSPYGIVMRLKGSNLIKALGWGTNNEKQHELLTRLANTAWALNSLLVKSEWEEGRHKKKTMVYIETSRLWELAVGVYGQKNIYGQVDEPSEVILQVRPGLWTTGFLNQGGAASREAFYHFGWLSKQIMDIPQYHNELAIQIAMRETISSHYRQNYRTVESFLLENKHGAASAIDEARKDRIKRHSLKQEWDKTLSTLENVEFTIIYDDKSYPPNLRPTSKRSPKGYFEKLLAAKLIIIPPLPQSLDLSNQSVTKTTSSTAINSNRPKKSRQKHITGSDIRQAREEAGVLATHLAKYFGKSRAWLSQKERGVRSLSQKEAEDIMAAIRLLSKKTQN